jgi:hypothetical protein
VFGARTVGITLTCPLEPCVNRNVMVMEQGQPEESFCHFDFLTKLRSNGT